MAHLLLLAPCVATSNSMPSTRRLEEDAGATRSALALLKAGDFEHLARQFSNSEGILALTLPGAASGASSSTRAADSRGACARRRF